MSLSTHPELRSYVESYRAARAEFDWSKSLSRPSAQLQLNAGGTHTTSSSVDYTGPSGSASLQLTQPVYDGGAAAAERDRTLSSAYAASERVKDQMNVVGLETAQAYVEVLRLQAARGILARHASAMNMIAQKLERRVQEGFGNDADLFDAKARADAARAQLVEVGQQLQDAADQYRAMTGSEPAHLSPLHSISWALPQRVEDAVSLAKGHSPKILALRYDALAAAAASLGTAAQGKPKLDLLINADHSTTYSDLGSYNSDISAQLSFRFQLYDGGAHHAKAAQAMHEAEASRLSAQAKTLETEKEIRQSWNAIKSARSRTPLLQAQFTHAQQSLEIHLKRFEAGFTPLEKIFDLENQVAVSNLAILNEKVSSHYNTFRILAATGLLVDALRSPQFKVSARQ